MVDGWAMAEWLKDDHGSWFLFHWGASLDCWTFAGWVDGLMGFGVVAPRAFRAKVDFAGPSLFG
jgi:hypothetical protein